MSKRLETSMFEAWKKIYMQIIIKLKFLIVISGKVNFRAFIIN